MTFATMHNAVAMTLGRPADACRATMMEETSVRQKGLTVMAKGSSERRPKRRLSSDVMSQQQNTQQQRIVRLSGESCFMRAPRRGQSCILSSPLIRAMAVVILLSALSPVTAFMIEFSPSSGPSISPSAAPSDSPSMTVIPSNSPSENPSSRPSLSPTDFPTTVPTSSPQPSGTPSTGAPTKSARPTLSKQPSDSPSTLMPTIFPSRHPSALPTDSQIPSFMPSMSAIPTTVPTESPAPTASPSNFPSGTHEPTNFPSISPSGLPSLMPSSSPTNYPTLEGGQVTDIGFYLQIFGVPTNDDPNSIGFNEEEQIIFQEVMVSYTINISGVANNSRITTTSEIRAQTVATPAGRRTSRRRHGRRLADVEPNPESQNNVDYRMSWTSINVNVTGYKARFASFINQNLELVTTDLQNAGLNVLDAEELLFVAATDSPSFTPTTSLVPSKGPSMFPTASAPPSAYPSETPSSTRSVMPTETLLPSLVPTGAPSPSKQGMTSAGKASLVVVFLLLGLVGAWYIYQRRKRQKEMAFVAAALSMQPEGRADQFDNPNVRTDLYGSRDPYNTPKSDDNVVGMISPSDSLLSNQSLLSAGNSIGGDSVDEADGTHHLADEFDQYKDQNLEKMRTEVEENITGAEGMMSQAMTLALMVDEDPVSGEHSDLYWGGSGDATEIEASALCEVNDWLKRKEGASVEERRAFMQETMNKMVASVRHGVILPDQASRTIHECAAMLGLELESSIPENTIIVTGLRKTVTKADLESTFSDFGAIDDAAVSSNARGFGLVRFVSPQYSQIAVAKYRTGEIVVQDVAVMVKLLKSDGSPWRDTAGSSDT